MNEPPPPVAPTTPVAPTAPSTAARRRQRAATTPRALAGPLLLLVGAGEATWSVVRYDWRIVAVYTVLATLLAAWLWRDGGRVRWTRSAAGLVLVVAAALIQVLPAFTYLPDDRARTVRLLLAGAALIAAAGQVAPWRHAPDAGLAVAVGGYLTATVLLLDADPAPRIDVWYTLQGAADALARGENPYTQLWVGPPGPMPAFTYLPWMAVLLAPGRWLAGDVRWALAVVTVAGALTVRALARTGTAVPRAPGPAGHAAPAAAMAALLLLLPGTQTQIEQAWTEPLLLTCLVGAGLALTRLRPWPAALLLALGLASKQHLALLLPVLAAWPRVGPRRTVVVAGLGGVLLAPFLLADPQEMWHDTVTWLIDFPPMRFSDTLFVAVLHESGRQPPFWLTGALILIAIGSVSWTVHRRNPGPGELLRWCALLLLIANLLNKQAFYNQYWLVLALLVASWAMPEEEAATAAPPPVRLAHDLAAPAPAVDGAGGQPTG